MIISRPKHRSSVEVCADCGASDPSWASINRGLLLCAECCSVHRSMGRHISHIKSLRQGSWPPSLLAMVQTLNAQNVNNIWEHSLLDTSAPKHLKKKPQPKDPLHPVKSEFIQAKHLRLAYILKPRRDEPPSELGRQLHSAVRSSSLDTAMRLLAQGADPNYYNQEKGTRCLHVACRGGQAAQAELLVSWGADPTARDHSGCTPAECARQAGHIELSARMTEVVYEATDRLIQHLCGTRPDHAAGQHYLLPRSGDAHHMTDVAKAARGKLQLLPNHLFEELVMDIYDEVDRRETEAIWQTSATGLERCGVVFLPVNPALSAPRNQGRQKLARLSAAELAALLRDVLVDATRRQHIATLGVGQPAPSLRPAHLRAASQVSDDEPLYDSVASDDDYAALAPMQLEQMSVKIPAPQSSEAMLSMPTDQSSAELRRTQSPVSLTQVLPEIETLKKELDSRDSTISELKSQLKNLQDIVEQLTKENSVLKTNSIDESESVTSLSVNEISDVKERGKSLETELKVEEDVRQKCGQRPVSMFETWEGPKNNWQLTKHQAEPEVVINWVSPSVQLMTTSGSRQTRDVEINLNLPTQGDPCLMQLSGLPSERVSSTSEGVVCARAPPFAEVQARAERVTRAIQQVWAAARERRPMLQDKAADITVAVKDLLALFPQPCTERDLNLILTELQTASDSVTAACGGGAGGDLGAVRAAAYQLAKATKDVVTHFQPS